MVTSITIGMRLIIGGLIRGVFAVDLYVIVSSHCVMLWDKIKEGLLQLRAHMKAVSDCELEVEGRFGLVELNEPTRASYK
ncbi:hypothetical protein TSMEX_003904 [Taenia solium]|eukprot:TsM_000386800 transcript=TsM_000386800 gene=TsM_000386800